jgi:diadenosine tetraphosphate (Ap4A) HIT family hydrolase
VKLGRKIMGKNSEIIMSDCIFCILSEKKELFVYENDSFYAIPDKFPASKGHTLIIAKKHYDNVFEMPIEQSEKLFQAIQETKKSLDDRYSPQAYNIGTNVGTIAGQSIFHFHFHIIPRYANEKHDSLAHTVQMP